MRIRTIITAAAVPALAAAALLAGTGAASAATTTAPAVTTAVVVKAPAQLPVIAHVYQSGVEDTTTAKTSVLGPNGYVWAHDNIERVITVKADGPDRWTVTFNEGGTYKAIAKPITGETWHHTGLFGGTITYTVIDAGTPKASNLPATLPGTNGHGAIMTALFGGVAPTVISAPYHFSYLGIPGAPGGVYTQVG
jgi:hypothetical protein